MYGLSFSSKVVINGFDGTTPLNTYIGVPASRLLFVAGDTDWVEVILSVESVLRFFVVLACVTDEEL